MSQPFAYLYPMHVARLTQAAGEDTPLRRGDEWDVRGEVCKIVDAMTYLRRAGVSQDEVNRLFADETATYANEIAHARRVREAGPPEIVTVELQGIVEPPGFASCTNCGVYRVAPGMICPGCHFKDPR